MCGADLACLGVRICASVGWDRPLDWNTRLQAVSTMHCQVLLSMPVSEEPFCAVSGVHGNWKACMASCLLMQMNACFMACA